MELELSRIFVKVVQNGSFSRAAEALRLPKSTVSKAVSRLEGETGTKLLLRTTRSLTLTQAGRVFFEASLQPILQLEDARKSLYGKDSILTGTLKLTAPEDLGSYVIAPAIAELSRRHPSLSFELRYTNEVLDLVRDGFDIAVRIGRLNESRLKAKRAGEVVLIPVASPKYLKDKDTIRQPADLKHHDCLTLNYRDTIERWTMRSSQGSTSVEVKAKITCNQMTSLLHMALAGGGVALVPSYICARALAAGKLVRLLPAWSTAALNVSILTPLAPSASARLKITVDHLHTALTRSLTKI